MKPETRFAGYCCPAGRFSGGSSLHSGAVGESIAASPARRTPARTETRRPRSTITVSARLPADPARVFDAWLDPHTAGQWLFATASQPMREVEIDARVHGRFRFADVHRGGRVEHAGEYLEIVPHRRLAFGLSAENRATPSSRVCVDIAPRPTGCTLTLSHLELPAELAWRTRERWIGILYGLRVMLDSRR